MKGLRYLLEHKKSFNLYVIHGGTNFGVTAGANAFGPTQYQPDITSYDYDAPVNEQGQPGYKYFALRDLIKQYVSYQVPDVPKEIPSINIPAFVLKPVTSICNEFQTPFVTPLPQPLEKIKKHFGENESE